MITMPLPTPPSPTPPHPIWYDASSSQSYPQHFVTFLRPRAFKSFIPPPPPYLGRTLVHHKTILNSILPSLRLISRFYVTL